MCVGPLDDGKFLNTMVKSIHLARKNVGMTVAGNTACLALSLNKSERRFLKREMAVLKQASESCRVFEAEMVIIPIFKVEG